MVKVVYDGDVATARKLYLSSCGRIMAEKLHFTSWRESRHHKTSCRECATAISFLPPKVVWVLDRTVDDARTAAGHQQQQRNFNFTSKVELFKSKAPSVINV